jgi:hypothetical protein
MNVYVRPPHDRDVSARVSERGPRAMTGKAQCRVVLTMQAQSGRICTLRHLIGPP